MSLYNPDNDDCCLCFLQTDQTFGHVYCLSRHVPWSRVHDRLFGIYVDLARPSHYRLHLLASYTLRDTSIGTFSHSQTCPVPDKDDNQLRCAQHILPTERERMGQLIKLHSQMSVIGLPSERTILRAASTYRSRRHLLFGRERRVGKVDFR